jgi:CDP-glycerol glycerophosphotransferase
MGAPLISILLVVYREQAYVRECVLSALGQPLSDVEVVAVDNASPDHGPELLDELAQVDSRLILRRLEHPVAIGEARNLALAAARGDYVWFVGTTDRIPAGALSAVAARLEETTPDLLVVGHTCETPPHDPQPGPYEELLARAPTGTFTLAEHPAALRLGREVRDKLFRRAFLEAGGWSFRPGGNGHLSVTYPALSGAERIATLPEVGYARYEPPNEAAEPVVHGLAADVFAQYDAVVPAVGGLASELVEEMADHYASLIRPIPAAQRDEFRAGAAASLERHGRPDLVERTLRTTPRPRRGTKRATRTLRIKALRRGGLRSAAARVLRRERMRPYYRRRLEEPVDPELAVFASYWYRGYACNPRAIYEKVLELAPSIRGVWVVDEEHERTMPAGLDYVVAGTRDYYDCLARAKYFVNNVNFPNEFVKRPGTIHVQTHHGTPLKTMGLDLRNAHVAGSRMNFERLLQRCSRWDYNISSNVFSTLIWERTYPLPYETLEVGYPRNDALVNATEADAERIRQELGIRPEQRVVLYAPTHREYLDRYEPTVDVAALASELGPDYVLAVRVHYFYERDAQPAGGAGILDVSAHPSVEALCLAADVLLTDYSSIMFDYAVLDRPIVVHAPDWEEYRRLRGTYFDLLAEPPGVVTRTTDELVTAFRTGSAWGEQANELRAAFRARFCALEDGRASERVVQRVWLDDDEPAAPEREPRARRRVEA